ncbi:MAG: cytochrome b N-terminal domain-containing protein [Anaerolineales bacterium]|jgi:ubiquinol-cytochrome c reductase cytochrome b subunit
MMNLTHKMQAVLSDNFTMEDLLPTSMPEFVNSVVYLFGVTALSSLGLLALTGTILAVFGPTWYHHSAVGHFINSLHFWGVQLFFFALVLHFISKFLMAAWRDGRWKTWMVGMVMFAIAVFTALTGFLAQTNWDSQWIAVQAKDLINAVGLGFLFDPMNIGQVLSVHLIVLPAMLVLLVGLHLLLVRREGPVKPIESEVSRDE